MQTAQAVIFGIVEGVTEFLPVSSTAHLMLTARYLGIPRTEFVKSFEIAIQSGAILAVAALYWKVLFKGWDIWRRLLVAFLPTAVVGALLYKAIKGFLLDSTIVAIAALFFGGAVLILFECFYRKKENTVSALSEISYAQAFLIGLFQSLAIIPGVSRSAATIVGGLIVGLGRRTIVEFSFLLAIPTMLSAMALDLAKSAHTFSAPQFFVLGVGFMVAFVVALAAVRFLLVFIKTHTFIPFGIYRMLIALAAWFNIR